MKENHYFIFLFTVNWWKTFTEWVIWKTRNIAKYQKKEIGKSMIFNMIKHETQFLFKSPKLHTNNDAFSTMGDTFEIYKYILASVMTSLLLNKLSYTLLSTPFMYYVFSIGYVNFVYLNTCNKDM